MQVDLTKCDQVAKLEFSYLHDQQILMQELIKFFGGHQYFDNNVRPLLTRVRTASNDYLEMPN